MSFIRNRDCSLLYRQILPILAGLLIGITVSVVLYPPEENGCPKNSFHYFTDIIDQNNQPVDLVRTDSIKNLQENTEDLSDYEPRINLAGKPHTAKKEPQSFVRPRYFSTELGIKDKIFVAVLSSVNQIATLGVALNKTLADHVNHMAFFVEIAENEKLDVKTLPIVGFKDSQQGLLTLHTLKYLAEKLADTYSFFFLIKDTTYVNGKKLVDTVNHISVTEDVYMGSTTNDLTTSPSICLIDGGIIFSSSVLQSVSPLLELCTEEYAFNSDDEKIGLCINKALNLTCQTQIQGQTFSTFNLNPYINDVQQLEKIWESHLDLQGALTAYHAKDVNYFYMLKKLTCSSALKEIDALIGELEQSILQLAPETPGGLEGVKWPIGSSPGSKTDTRFNVLRWEYFNASHILFSNEQSVTRLLSGINLEDIQEVINASVANVLSENPGLRYFRLINGYRRFDPTRGMDYILDLLFRTPSDGDVLQRLEACRPLTRIDTVPMPYVTESSIVHIILIVWEEQQVKAAEKFIDSYSKNMMAKSDKTELTLILFSLRLQEKKYKDLFETLKRSAETLSNQYKKQASRINIASYKLNSLVPSDMIEFIAIDLLSSRLAPESLVFVCNPFSEILSDLLNRVRINTISGWQIYSPIPFFEYNPNVTIASVKKPGVFDVSTNQGFYNNHDTLHISFYMSDYLNARQQFRGEMPLVKAETDVRPEAKSPYQSLLSMFIKLSRMHILRGVEPQLRVRYHQRKCHSQSCHESLLLSQGTRSQLAQFALEREALSSIK